MSYHRRIPKGNTKKIGIPRYKEAAKAIALNLKFASDVVVAADGERNEQRNRLLKACGLKENRI